MKAARLWVERATFLLAGAVVAIGFLFLTGADLKPPAPNYGRYQISAWGDSSAHGVFITDTTSGETKVVYRYKKISSTEGVERNYLGLSFHSIE